MLGMLPLSFCFYSILVRLKEVFGKSDADALICFYSILVRLKEGKSVKHVKACPSFYSILVRLKVVTSSHTSDSFTKFLFHTGSIKRVPSLRHPCPEKNSFYSILVRLKDYH